VVGWSDILVIGAGPYGLSLAAHLRANGADFRIVGRVMEPWRTAMPAGMFLKSEGFASTLFEPRGVFTLAAYCAEQGVRYADTGVPVRVETFVAYGQTFQQRLVPGVEDRQVTRLRRTEGGFEATCADGEVILARQVVMASGILHFTHIPQELNITTCHASAVRTSSSSARARRPWMWRPPCIWAGRKSACWPAAHRSGSRRHSANAPC